MSPSTIVDVVETRSAGSAPTSIDTWFLTGFAEKGPIGAYVEVRSLAAFIDKLGARLAAAPNLYDAVDAHFQEGAARIYVSRTGGPAPVKATGPGLQDAALVATARVDAVYPGDWGNRIKRQIVAGTVSGFVIVAQFDNVEVERSPDLASKAAAVAWAANSNYIRFVDLGAGGNPVPTAAASLTSGTDDRSNATNATWNTARAVFTDALGAGQLSDPGRTTDPAHLDILASAAAAAPDRFAVLDAPDDHSTTTLKTTAAALTAGANGRLGGLFAPWVTMPGPLQGQTRLVPPSAVVAGIIARNDNAGVPADEPSAGLRYGVSQTASGLSQAGWTQAEEDQLTAAGVNILKVKRGNVIVWGYRTLANPATDAKFLDAGPARLLMQIEAQAGSVAEQFVLRRIDGRRHLMVEFDTALRGILAKHFAAGSLASQFDAGVEIPDSAYAVDVGPTVNTTATIVARELNAVLVLHLTTMAETVRVHIVRRAQEENL